MKAQLSKTIETLCEKIQEQALHGTYDLDLIRETTAMIAVTVQEDETWDIEEAAPRLRVSIETLRKLVRQGKIPHFRIGFQIFFRKSELDKWIVLQMETSVKRPPAEVSVPRLRRA